MGIRNFSSVNRLMNIKVIKRGVSTAARSISVKKQGAMFRDFLGQEWDLSDYPDSGLIPMPTYNFLTNLNYGNVRALIHTAPKVDGARYNDMAGSEHGKIPMKGITKLETAGLVSTAKNTNGEKIFSITKLGREIIKLHNGKEMYHIPLGVHPNQSKPVTEQDMYGNFFYKSSMLDPATGTYMAVTTNYGKDRTGKLRSYSDGISSPKDDFIAEFADVAYDKKNFGKTMCDISSKAVIYESKDEAMTGNQYTDRNGQQRLTDRYVNTNPNKVKLKPVAFGHHLFGDLYCLQGEQNGQIVNVEISHKVLNYFVGKYGADLDIYIPDWDNYRGSSRGSVFFMKDKKLVGINLKSYKPSQTPDFKKLYVPNADLKQLLKAQPPSGF